MGFRRVLEIELVLAKSSRRLRSNSGFVCLRMISKTSMGMVTWHVTLPLASLPSIELIAMAVCIDARILFVTGVLVAASAGGGFILAGGGGFILAVGGFILAGGRDFSSEDKIGSGS